MGQILHGSATTTEAVRRAIQHSQESLIALSKRYSINPKAVAKWQRRSSSTLHGSTTMARASSTYSLKHRRRLERDEIRFVRSLS